MKIADLAISMRAGGTPPRADATCWNGDIPFVKIEDLTAAPGGHITSTAEGVTQTGIDRSSAWIVPPGHVLLAMYASIGAVAINDVPVATNQAIIAIQPNPEIVEGEFLRYSLRFFADDLASRNVQTTQRNVNAGIVRSFEIPVPPLADQRRIVRFMSAVERAQQQHDSSMNAAVQVERSMREYFFASIEAPRAPLASLVTDLRNGLYKPRRAYGDVGTPIVRINDYPNSGGYLAGCPLRVVTSRSELDQWGLRNTDILLNRVNSVSHIGKVALINDMEEPMVYESNMIRVRVEASLVVAEFLFQFLRTVLARQHFVRTAKRAVAQSSINQGDIGALQVPLPPITEQAQIVKLIQAAEAASQGATHSRAALDTVYRAALRNLLGAAA